MGIKLSPVKRGNMIARLKRLGFEGPFSGGKHQFLVKGTVRLTLPNPHASELGPFLLARILQQAGVALDEWNRTG